MIKKFQSGVFFFFVLINSILQAAPLTKIEGCTIIPTDWADGDSFQIQIPEKPADVNGPGHKARKIALRLYGVDCIEAKVSDKSDSDRLRSQRRYFGITEVGGNPQASIDLALMLGKQASEETANLLAKPFTIHTSFADGRGDPDFKRYYAFVMTKEGKDLASVLVSKGLAKASGVARETPDGKHRDDYKAELSDIELQAAKTGLGIWEHTDWEKLPKERQIARQEDRELELAKDKAPPKKMDINKAAKDQLITLPNIGEVKANSIIENRPYRKAEDLLEVDGIKNDTLEKIKPFLIFPEDEH